MDKNQKIILVVGGLAVLGLFLVEPFFALIALVFVIVAMMSLHIMRETNDFPFIAAELSENAREIIVINTGTARAQKIHVDIVPLDVEFDIDSLDPDEESKFCLESMISEAKAVVTYENREGKRFQRSYPITALGACRDITKPMFPIFGDR
ncbi:MAG: hypothetical protein GX837_01160 [Methanomicrobiales archaeon]|jgi:hypothetical protein|nr:hypothetical protein [Methanomicrobiales archaeon]